MARVQKSRKYGLLDQAGKLVLEPQFDQIQDFNEKTGLAWVRAGGKWGLIDQTGRIVLEPHFNSIGDFGDQLGGLWPGSCYLSMEKPYMACSIRLAS